MYIAYLRMRLVIGGRSALQMPSSALLQQYTQCGVETDLSTQYSERYASLSTAAHSEIFIQPLVTL